MSESLRLTVRFEDAGEGWILATIPEVPGAVSQGRTRAEARGNLGHRTARTGDRRDSSASDRSSLEAGAPRS